MRQTLRYCYETLFSEFMRYCMAGGIAFLADYAVLHLLTGYAGIHYLLSTLAGFTVGIAVSYFLSMRWVFKSSQVQGLRPLFTFSVIGVTGLVMTEILMWLGVEVFSFNYMLVKVAVTGVVLVWNFTARKMLVFASPYAGRHSSQRL